MSNYTATAKGALRTISAKGATVTFHGNAAGSVYNAATDTWSGSVGADVTGYAVQVPPDLDRMRALGLVLANSVTLIVAASGLSVTPSPGMSITWASTGYTIRDVEATAPNGTPIIYTVTGEA